MARDSLSGRIANPLGKARLQFVAASSARWRAVPAPRTGMVGLAATAQPTLTAAGGPRTINLSGPVAPPLPEPPVRADRAFGTCGMGGSIPSMKALSAAVVAGSLLAGCVLWAQSLAEIAQREEARRKTIAQPSRVYTNADLAGGRTPSATPPAAVPDVKETPPAAAATPPASESDAEPAVQSEEPPKNEPVKDEAYWRARIGSARADLERKNLYLEALQNRVNSLATDFVNRDDPAQRAVIEVDHQRTLAELARLKADVQAQTKAIAAIEEEARRAGVPPGWLR